MTMTAELDKEHRAFLRRLRADFKEAAASLGSDEARYLVDLYYQVQEFRKAAKNQVRAEGEPNYLLSWVGDEFRALENTVKRAMDVYTDQHEVTRWAKSIVGVGPVLAGGLLSQIDITKAKTAGSVWRFAGVDPSVTWGKGKKRPWNARLKVLVWKFSDCQVKFSNHESSFYGPLYKQYKAELTAKNEAGEFAEAAAASLARLKDKTTDTYKANTEGRLSKGHIDARAKRWIGKLFLSHWHEVAYLAHYGEPAPKPYAIAHLDHAHKIEVPR